MKHVYLDNAATTKMDKRVKEEIYKSFDIYGNPSSNHTAGFHAHEMVENSRRYIEDKLKLKPKSFIFTGSGSESNNMAIKMAAEYGLLYNKNKIITSTVEHSSVLKTVEALRDVEVQYIGVDSNGRIDMNELFRMIDYKTSLVSIMTSNNETGVMFDIYTIADMAHNKGALFHTDAIQGITHTHVVSSFVDMISISGHKFGAPKGIGGLYINPSLIDDFKQHSITKGGNQEFGLRSGTENTPYIIGLSEAVDILVSTRENKKNITTALYSYFVQELVRKFPYCKINGDVPIDEKNPSIVNFSIGFADASSVVTWMALNDICISSGSACNTGSHDPSHVLTSMGISREDAFSSLRISFSENNTFDEIDYFMKKLKEFEMKYKL